jgi:alpha-amylase
MPSHARVPIVVRKFSPRITHLKNRMLPSRIRAMKRVKEKIASRNLVLCFQIHQPCRIKKLSPEGVQAGIHCFDEESDQAIIQRIATHCYRPMNNMLLRLVRQHPEIRVCFAMSGTTIDQLSQYAPDVIASFKELVGTGCIDFLAETYFNSIAFMMEGDEFEVQIIEHCEKLIEVFGVRPSVFRNTNFVYNDSIGRRISMLGFRGVLIEGNEKTGKHVSPHFLYNHKDENGLKILMRNYRLSDDIAFHVHEWALTPETFISWLDQIPNDEKLINICVDYETFGEHNDMASGLSDFMESLFLLVAMQKQYRFALPSEIVEQYDAEGTMSLPEYTMISGSELTDWFGNDNQRKAFTLLDEVGSMVKNLNNPEFIRQWRSLQGCEHFSFMSEKADHSLSPYSSSLEAFDCYVRALECFKNHIQRNPEIINEILESDRRTLHAPEWAMKIEHGTYHH